MLAAIVLPVAMSCGGDNPMRAEVTIEGLGTQNVRVIYADDRAVNSATVTVIDSKFSFEAQSPEETVFEIYSNSRALLGRFAGKNGDNIELTLKLSDPAYMKVSGNKTSEELAGFLSSNSGRDLNDAIARQVSENPGGMLSAILMTYYFDFSGDPGEGAMLTDMLTAKTPFRSFTQGNRRMLSRLEEPQGKVEPMVLFNMADTVEVFEPDSVRPTLLWFDSKDKAIGDSIAERLDSIGMKRFLAAHILISSDTFGWRRSMSPLPKQVRRLYAPGGIASPDLYRLSITGLPFFIVTDSIAEQVYRGKSLDAALDSVKSLLSE